MRLVSVVCAGLCTAHSSHICRTVTKNSFRLSYCSHGHTSCYGVGISIHCMTGFNVQMKEEQV
eukprot:m.189042 g.189042  ORF g.189042 m.189042 type:complete len:63 (-) comp17611_c0_seq1:1195-1383(-)